MAKNDYEVIVCKILIHFYKRLQGKCSEEDIEAYINANTKQLPISEDYLNAVLLDLIEAGFIADAKVVKAWGGDIMYIDTNRARVTLKGVEYLRSNSIMRKIAETLKEAAPIWSLFQ